MGATGARSAASTPDRIAPRPTRGSPNRLSVATPSGTTSAIYDAQDRLLTYGTLTFTYTANGELETKTDSSNGNITAYQYDAFGNLKRVDLPNGDVIQYLVDGMNRRIGKKKNGSVVKYWVYSDQLHPIEELDGSGALLTRFIYASGKNSPDLVVQNNTEYRVLSDQLGSPRLVVNATTGAVVQRMREDEFGNVLEDTAPGFTPFGFAGGLYDPDTGLVRFGARDYDPVVGRWISKDPTRFEGRQANLYAYVHDDPVNFVDRSGRQSAPSLSPWALILAGAEGGAAIGAVFEGVGAIPGSIIGALLAAASVPGDTPSDNACEIRGEGKQLDQISKDQGIPRDQLRKALEAIKNNAGLRGDENVTILPDGTVIDPVSGDEIGNIHDEQGN